MILKELSEALTGEYGAACLVPGDLHRPVRGLAVDEDVEGWLFPGDVAFSSRETMEPEFIRLLHKGGSPALIWRAEPVSSPEIAGEFERLGVGLFTLPKSVPLRKLLAFFTESDGLLLYSHSVARTLLESSGSVEDLSNRVSALLDRQVLVEDPIGRLLAGDAEDNLEGLAALLERHGLRASKRPGVEETQRERRDRYARLPDGFLSVPLERWRVASEELFWTPIGGRTPAGYLWVDLRDDPLEPRDVVILYWARRVLEVELGKERVRLETEMGVRGDFVDDLVSGHYGSVELLLQRAGYLGADLSSGALVVIVDIDDFARYLQRRRLKEPAIQELKRRLAEAVRLQTREMFSNFLLGPRSDNVILFLGPSEEEPQEITDRALALAGRIQRYVRGLLPDLTVSVGIGRYKSDPALLPDAYSEAGVALEIGHRISGPSSISTFEDTGTYKLLFRVLQEDPQELEAFYRETLEPVVLYDSRYSTELVHTLTTYLDNNTSTLKTASTLFTHRHTIRYRLDRITELTGLDVEKSEDRERLTLGIKSMQLLGRAPGPPPSFRDR